LDSEYTSIAAWGLRDLAVVALLGVGSTSVLAEQAKGVSALPVRLVKGLP